MGIGITLAHRVNLFPHGKEKGEPDYEREPNAAASLPPRQCRNLPAQVVKGDRTRMRLVYLPLTS